MTREKFNFQDKVILSVGQGKKGIYLFCEWHESRLNGHLYVKSPCQKNVKVSDNKDKAALRKVKKIMQEHASEISDLYMFGYFEQSIKFFKELNNDNK